MRLSPTKRHLRELLHVFKLTYEEIGKQTNIDPIRLKAINKNEMPSPEEAERIEALAISTTFQRRVEAGD